MIKGLSNMTLYLITAILGFVILRQGQAAPFAGKSSSPEGCLYNGAIYPSGEKVPTEQPCLNCTCMKNSLVCFLRVCPKFPHPPPKGCHIAAKSDKCCPDLICDEGNKKITIEEDGSHITKDAGVSTSNKKVSPTINTSGCMFNGSLYAEGSAMVSTNHCEYCFCVKSKSRCIKPKCVLPLEGCIPRYTKFSCCPTHYECDASKQDSIDTALQNMRPHSIMGIQALSTIPRDELSTDDHFGSIESTRPVSNDLMAEESRARLFSVVPPDGFSFIQKQEAEGEVEPTTGARTVQSDDAVANPFFVRENNKLMSQGKMDDDSLSTTTIRDENISSESTDITQEAHSPMSNHGVFLNTNLKFNSLDDSLRNEPVDGSNAETSFIKSDDNPADLKVNDDVEKITDTQSARGDPGKESTLSTGVTSLPLAKESASVSESVSRDETNKINQNVGNTGGEDDEMKEGGRVKTGNEKVEEENDDNGEDNNKKDKMTGIKDDAETPESRMNDRKISETEGEVAKDRISLNESETEGENEEESHDEISMKSSEEEVKKMLMQIMAEKKQSMEDSQVTVAENNEKHDIGGSQNMLNKDTTGKEDVTDIATDNEPKQSEVDVNRERTSSVKDTGEVNEKQELTSDKKVILLVEMRNTTAGENVSRNSNNTMDNKKLMEDVQMKDEDKEGVMTEGNVNEMSAAKGMSTSQDETIKDDNTLKKEESEVVENESERNKSMNGSQSTEEKPVSEMTSEGVEGMEKLDSSRDEMSLDEETLTNDITLSVTKDMHDEQDTHMTENSHKSDESTKATHTTKDDVTIEIPSLDVNKSTTGLSDAKNMSLMDETSLTDKEGMGKMVEKEGEINNGPSSTVAPFPKNQSKENVDNTAEVEDASESLDGAILKFFEGKPEPGLVKHKSPASDNILKPLLVKEFNDDDSFEIFESTDDGSDGNLVLFTSQVSGVREDLPDLGQQFIDVKQRNPSIAFGDSFKNPDASPLPNLQIIPFVAADAVTDDFILDDKEVELKIDLPLGPTKQQSFVGIGSVSPVLPPAAENDVIKGTPITTQKPILFSIPLELTTAFDFSTSYPPTIETLSRESEVKDKCFFDNRLFDNGELITKKDPCVLCRCYFGDILCQKTECPPIPPGCKPREQLDFCCPQLICENGTVTEDGAVQSIPDLKPIGTTTLQPPPRITTTAGPFEDVIKTQTPPKLLDFKFPNFFNDNLFSQVPLFVSPIVPKTSKPLSESVSEPSPTPTTTSTTTKPTTPSKTKTNEFINFPLSSNDVKPDFFLNALNLSGCNIYGRMYRVGRVIDELSGPCIECKCTPIGVECENLKC